MDHIKIHVQQADIIFKALRYVALHEGLEISQELEKTFEVLAEYNPSDTHVADTVDVMEHLNGFIKDHYRYSEHFENEE